MKHESCKQTNGVFKIECLYYVVGIRGI